MNSTKMPMTREALYVCMATFVTLFCAGCDRYQNEYSDILHEDATVLSVVHTPSRHELKLKDVAAEKGLAAVDFDGNIGLNLGEGVQLSHSVVPEKFAVVFDCQHGQFIVEGKARYDKFNRSIGKLVDVTYKEIYQDHYTKEGGKWKLAERVITGYDFINATVLE